MPAKNKDKMMTGPNGEMRPADPNQRAKMILDIATGEIEEDTPCRRFTLTATECGKLTPQDLDESSPH